MQEMAGEGAPCWGSPSPAQSANPHRSKARLLRGTPRQPQAVQFAGVIHTMSNEEHYAYRSQANPRGPSHVKVQPKIQLACEQKWDFLKSVQTHWIRRTSGEEMQKADCSPGQRLQRHCRLWERATNDRIIIDQNDSSYNITNIYWKLTGEISSF